jgi:probable F420-dependent oxidoreductase
VRIATTVPTQDPRRAADLFADLERIGYDTAFSFESKHDPFLPLALASANTDELRLGTAVAIGFARNPMVLANVGYDLQLLTEGRFVLGLGSQVRPHIERRFSETWSRPAARMRELVLALSAIWSRWQGTADLRFEGEFYRHTLMTPAFDPGPNPFGPPPVFIGGFGPRMIEVAGEVADGLIVHPFNSRRSLEEFVIPALARGRAVAGRDAIAVEIVWVQMVVTWTTDEERATAFRSARDQMAFYGSTPAYAPVLDLHGYADLHPELNRLSKEGRWDDMAALIPDELIEQLAVVGPRREIAGRLRARSAGIADTVSLVNNRNPDPDNFADIVTELRSPDAGQWTENPASA